MKTLIISTIVIVIILFAFSSCKKASISPSYVGYWQGKAANDLTSYPTNPISFLFRTNGSVRFYSGSKDSSTAAQKFEGIYTVTGNTINTTFTTISVETTSTLNSNNNFQEGVIETSTWTANFFLSK